MDRLNPDPQAQSALRSSRRWRFSLLASRAWLITGTYALLAGLWIYYSDRALLLLTDPDQLMAVSMYKGWFFVGATSLLLLMMMRRAYGSIERGNAALRQLNEHLQAKTVELERANQRLKRDAAKRQKLEVERTMLIDALGERVRELRSLIGTGELLRDDRGDLQEVLTAMVLHLPESMRFPQHACARIRWAETIVDSPGFAAGRRQLHSSFRTSDGLAGEVTLAYRDDADQSITFLGEEQAVLDAVAEQLRGFLDRRQIHQALQVSEARFRELAENVREIFFSVDAVTDQVLYVNPVYERIWGRPCADAYNDPGSYLQSIHPDDREQVVDANRRLRAGETIEVEYRIIRPDQQLRWLQEHAVPIRAADGSVERKVGSVRDITIRMQADARLRESEQRFRILAQATNDAIWDYHIGSDRMWWSDGMESLFGYPPEALEPGLESLVNRIHPDERQTIEPQIRAICDDGDGSWSAQFRFARRNGEYAHVRSRAQVLRDRGGSPLRMVGGLTDVSDQHRAERALEQSLIDLGNRNRELQDFAFVASHDLQEPLRKIRTFADILQQRHASELPGKVSDYLQRMDKAALRMQTLIDDLLAYSRVATRDFRLQEVDLGRICREVTVDLEERTRSSGAELHIEALPTITADPVQMRQLLQNLLANALKFRHPERKPVISVSARPVRLDGSAAVELLIADNGMGFEMRFAEGIFEPFKRVHTGSEIKGSGIGLAIVRRIVDRHRGKVLAVGKPGEGAEFKVILPVIQTASPAASES